MDLAPDCRHVEPDGPVGVVGGELRQVADPPDVIANPIGVAIAPGQGLAGNLLTQVDRLEHRAVARPPYRVLGYEGKQVRDNMHRATAVWLTSATRRPWAPMIRSIAAASRMSQSLWR